MRTLLYVFAAMVILGQRSTESQELSARDRTEDRALGRLHATLRHPAGPSDASRHDAYLSLIGFGNETSLPLLLNRLRLDYGEMEPVAPAGVKLGFVCTQVHLVDAIRYITNTDEGMFYPRWAIWWEVHRGYSRLRWVLDGFSEGGMHVIDPPDGRFGVELIEALAGKREYYALNAHWLLVRVPTRERTRWVISAASSDRPSVRLGALRDLQRIDTSGHDDLIQKLTGDTDPEVRQLAVSTLTKRRAVKR